jgi:tRNA pseudouridine38-40 synthase
VHVSGDYVIFELAANGFLHHMVRNIVGSLIYVGNGRQDPEWLARVLSSRDRALAAPTVDAAGLYLEHVSYDAKWGLPQRNRSAWPYEKT